MTRLIPKCFKRSAKTNRGVGRIVEQLAHAEFLLQGANKGGVNIRGISDDTLSV